MPTVPFQSYLRLTHSGSTNSSILIPDLDVGYENQQRKSPAYVPVGGYIDVPLTTRVLYSVMQGTIAAFAQRGLLTVSAFSYARDADNLGGTGTGIQLNALVAQNVRRLGNALSFVINAGLDTSGFLVGERVTVVGLAGAFSLLNGTYIVSAFVKGQDFAGINPLAAIVSVPSVGAAIPADLVVGVTLTLPDGMTTHLYESSGNAGGMGAGVRTYFAGDMVLTGALDPDRVIFSPVDLGAATPNTLGVDVNTGLLTFINESGVPVPLDGSVPPLAEQVIVAKSGGSFTSVATAISSIVDAAESKPYIVTIGPGIFDEPPFTIPSYVTVIGSGPYATVLQTTTNLAHFINGSPAAEIDNVMLKGPTSAGFACINYEGTGTEGFRVFNVELHEGYYGIWAHPASSGLILCDEVFNYSQGLLHTFMYASGRAIFRGVICAYRDDTAKGNTYGFRCEGANVQMYLDNCIYKDANGTYGAYIDGGGQMRLTNFNCAAGNNGLYVGPTGASRLDSASTVIRPAVVNHVTVDSITAEVLISGVVSQSKVTVASGATFIANFMDPAGGTNEGTVNVGEFYLAYPNGNEIPVRDYLGFTANTGLGEGGAVTRNIAGGLLVDVAQGEGFLSLDPEQGVIEVYWADQTIELTDNVQWWLVVDATGTITEVFAQPDPTQVVVLSGGVTQGSEVVFINPTPVTLYQTMPATSKYANEVLGPINVSGTLATPSGVAPTLALDVGSGVFYINNSRKVFTGGSAITFTAWYKVGASWTAVQGETTLDDARYNNPATGRVALTAGWWVKHVLYVSVNGAGDPEYHVVYGQEQAAAKGTLVNIPTPPNWLSKGSQRSCALYVQQGSGDIAAADIEDIRPRLGQLAPSTAGVTLHGDLLGLNADDHTQYQLRSEKGAISGYCGLDASQKVAATNILFTSTAASNVTAGLPSAGAGTEVARQNHVHFHGNLDSVDGTVTALHGNAVAGVKPGFISAADQTKLDGLAILHASRHAIGGTDVLTPAAIGAWTKAESDTRDTLRQGGLRADPTWTDHLDGTITVDALTAVLFANADFSGHPEQYTLPAVTHTPPAGKSYVVGDYNGGGPGVPTQKIITDVALITESTVIPVATLYTEGTDISILSWDTVGRGLANKLHQRFVKTTRFVRESGLELSEEIGRKVHVAEGRTWYGAVGVTTPDYISGDPGTETFLLTHVGGVWTRTTVTQYNNSQYDDGTDVQSVSPGKYAVNWIYRGLCGNHNRVAIVLGSGDYSNTEASSSQPQTPPASIMAMCVLVGRIIVEAGEATAYNIEGAFDVVFSGVEYPSHNDLEGLNIGDYKHLTAAQNTGLTGGAETALHSHAHGNQLGGTLHAAVVAGGTAGFMTGTDKTKLDGIASGAAALTAAAPADVTKAAADVGAATSAARADHKHDVSTAAPVAIGTANSEGAATSLARSNHIHDHGSQTVGTHHAAVVAGGTSGFMTGTDKTKLDGLAITHADRHSIGGADVLTPLAIGASYPVFAQTASVSAATSGVEGTLIGAGTGSITLPANFLTVGKTISIQASGYYTRTAGDDLRVRIYLGATVILDTGVLSPSTVTNLGWRLEILITCRTTGAPGTVMGQGSLALSTSTTASSVWQLVNTGAAIAVTTTGTLATNLTALWSGTGNNMTCTNLIITSLN